MAEQNRKTPEQQKLRAAAEAVVDMFLEYLLRSDLTKDITWEGRNILEMAVKYQGSGFSGFCTLGAKVDRINRQYITEDMAQAATAMALLSDKQVEALAVDRALRGRTRVLAVDPFNPDEPVTQFWDDRQCAHYLRCSIDAMRRRITDGYQKLESFIDRKKKAA